MATKSIVSYSSTLSSSSIGPAYFSQEARNRGLLQSPFPSLNAEQRHNVGVKAKILNVRPKAGLRDNVEATGVPTSVPVRVAHELLQAGHRYLDVRTPEEFGAGHAVGAINIPYMYRVGSRGMTMNPEFVEEVTSHFGKFDEIIVGCQTGKRSMMAAIHLLAAGFGGVTDIAGGFAAWRHNELPIEY